MSSFMWLHQQTGSVFLSFSGPCLAAVSVVCVAQSVFPPAAIFSFKRSAYVGHPISSNERASQGLSSQDTTRIHHLLCASRTVHSSSKERPTIWKYPNKG